MEAISIIEAGVTRKIEIANPLIGPEDVLIDISYVGLCGSDLNIFRGAMPMVSYPRIPGHEVSGVIIKKGPKVPESLNIGDKAVISPYTNCGECPACVKNRPNTCQFNQTLGVQRDGALSSQISVHHSKVFKSELLPLEELVLVEPLSVGYHAANRAKITKNDLVLVLGCGTIGMGALCGCVNKGATVLVSDIDDEKIQLARKMGAQYAVNSNKTNLSAYIKDLTNGNGVDAVIEAAGIAETVRQAVSVAAFAGRIAFIGYTKKAVELETKLIVQKELDIYGSRNALNVFPDVIKMLEERKFPYPDLISRVYPFEQAGQALKDWDKNPAKFMKILIKINNKKG